MRIHKLALTITLMATTQAHPHDTPVPLPNHLITQFPQPSWIENIAVRPNGDLLLTQLFFTPSATLYTLPSPSSSPVPSPVALHTFANVTSLLGIAESSVHADLFVLVGGVNPTATTPGSFSAWTIDFRSHDSPIITHLADLTSAVLPNGVCSVPQRNAVLIADSFAGLTWHLDIATGSVSIAVQVPEMARPEGSPATTVGINGLKVHGGYLYWTNSGSSTIYKTKVDADGRACKDARVETAAKLDALFLDDFAVGEDGLLWAATNSDNRLFAVDSKTGKSVVVAGAVGELTLAGDTAAAFGRGKDDKEVLYVVTCGGLRQKVNGTLTEGGKVVAVDTKGFRL